MLYYSDDGRKAILGARQCVLGYGNTTEVFTNALNSALAGLSFRQDNVHLVNGDTKVKIENKHVKITCEFGLRWINQSGETYMVGGLVYHNTAGAFGVHT